MDYIALIHKDKESDYGISFPDFPGCISAGVTIEEAKVMGEEALTLHVEYMIDMNESLPIPSSYDEIMEDIDHKDALLAIHITISKPTSVRVNVCFSKNILDAIDEKAHKCHLNRSAFLAQAAMDYEVHVD